MQSLAKLSACENGDIRSAIGQWSAQYSLISDLKVASTSLILLENALPHRRAAGHNASTKSSKVF